MPILGRKVTVKGSVLDLGIGTGNPDIYVTTYGPITAPGWVERYGAWLGKRSGPTQNIVVGHFLSDEDRVPTAFQGSKTFSVSPFLTAGTSGAAFEGAPDTSVFDLDANGIPLTAGSYPAIFVYNLDQGTVSYEANDELLFSRDTLLAIPDPFGDTYLTQEEGQLDAYILWRANSRPSVPRASMSPAHESNVADITPTLAADFSDADKALGDRMTQYHIQVRRKSNRVMVWDAVLGASESEQAADRFSAVYAGSALTDITYEWRARVSDYHFAWSSFTDWRDFTVTSGPKVLQPTAPTGKQETITPGPFEAFYNHTDGRSYNQVQIEIWNASGGTRTTLRNSSTITMSGGDNTTISIPWQSGWFALEWSRQYIVRIRARDNQNKYSPWSDDKVFNTNYAPTTPTNLSPNDATARGVRPTITAISSDLDDTVASGLGVEFRVKGPAVLSNTDFPTNIVGWTSTLIDTGVSSINSWDGVEGSPALGSLRMAVAASGSVAGNRYRLGLNENIPVVPGEVYRITHNRKAANPNNVQAKLGVFWFQADGVTPSAVFASSVETFSTGYVQPTNEWETKAVTFTAPSDARFARIAAVAEVRSGTVASTNVWFDGYKWDEGNTRFIRAATLRVGTLNTWDYLITATDAAAFGIYKYDARSFDGSYTSPWSSEARFSYQNVPTITITYPIDAGTIETPVFQINWTTSDPGGQVAHRAYVYEVGNDDTPVYDSGLVTQSELLQSIPLGYLHHGGTYYAFVDSTGVTSGLTGRSNTVTFTLDFPQPDPITNFSINPYAVAGDTEPSAHMLQWDVSNVPQQQFAEYTIYRRGLAGSDADREEIILRRITAVSQNTFLDMFPTSGVPYVYTIRQAHYVGLDAVESEPTTANGQIDLSHVIIAAAAFGSEVRASLRYMQDNDIEHVSDFETVIPWGEKEPTLFVGPTDYDVIDATFAVIDDRYGQALTNMNNLRQLDADKTVSCYRDHRGRKVFGFMELSEKDNPANTYEVDLTITETSFREGEV